jgi:putative transposase
VTPAEIDVILAITEEWGEVDRSHRKLAHRGSYLGRLWVSPSTFRRVLAAHGLVLPEPPARDPTPRPGWPDWLEWAPNRIWCWDVTHFGRARRVAFAFIDVISSRWIDTLVSVEETSTQVQVLFDRAVLGEGLAELITPGRLELAPDDPARPILLACSDNDPQMTSAATRQFLAGLAAPNASAAVRAAEADVQRWLDAS